MWMIDTAVLPNFFLNIFTNNLKHCFYKEIWLGCTRHSGVIDTDVYCKYDTAVTLNLIFEWLWLPLKGISIQKIFIGKLSCTTPITFTQKIWGLTRDRILSQRCHWHYCDENRRFHSLFSPRIRSHIQKGFNPCIRGLGELFDEKNRGQ
jgi:hypothetical protein